MKDRIVRYKCPFCRWSIDLSVNWPRASVELTLQQHLDSHVEEMAKV